jgi:hypothetical protein
MSEDSAKTAGPETGGQVPPSPEIGQRSLDSFPVPEPLPAAPPAEAAYQMDSLDVPPVEASGGNARDDFNG